MSFPNLISGGAECGPVNPTTGLVKHLVQDKSLQKDRFLRDPTGEGSSRGVFRTRRKIPLEENQIPDQYFNNQTQIDEAFHFDQMGKELNAMQHEVTTINTSDWANEFLKQANTNQPPTLHNHEQEYFEEIYSQGATAPTQVDWAQEFSQITLQSHLNSENQELLPEEEAAFERAFDEANKELDEQSKFNIDEGTSWAAEFEKEQEAEMSTDESKTKLAISAGKLVETIEGETNPKFKNSVFLNFMKKLRDQELSVEGNKIVEQKTAVAMPKNGWVSEFEAQQQQNLNWANEFKFQTANSNVFKEPSKAISDRETNLQKERKRFDEEFERQWNQNSTRQRILRSKGLIDWTSEFQQTEQNSLMSDKLEMNNSNEEYERKWNEYAKRENFLPLSNLINLRAEAEKMESEERKTKNDSTKNIVDSSNLVEENFNDFNVAKLTQESGDIGWDELQSDWDRYTPHYAGYQYSDEYKNYKFQSKNPYLPTPDHILKQSVRHGSLKESILALEATVQLKPLDANAWHLLGIRQQENEQDIRAIAALRKAVSLNPKLSDGWMALAVSYTNQNMRSEIYNSLESWLRNHDKYAQIYERERGKGPVLNQHKLITDSFLQAAISNPQYIDAEVQIGLGVLFYVSEEYDKAIDCLLAALSVRPNDYLIWNKLGATYANSHRPEKSMDAYFNALEIKPTFIRARYNLAVSCLNLGQIREATEHLLVSLALQDLDIELEYDELSHEAENGGVSSADRPLRDPTIMSSNIWDTLKMCCVSMHRQDLVAKCDQRDLKAFRQHFDF
ncbi:8713_t:CDS:2 [Ambispora gerdemannii]|uniref:8713_t:CDS:1 n=1 Tax=Ambispora gerdemannii TaxID=144530 RepID=A0A9N8W9Q3_9GLOM|nr:8713_t:CDS:2 [Ambispora gerdemannii]